MDRVEVLSLFIFQKQIVEQLAIALHTFINVIFLLKSLADDVSKSFDRREFFTSNRRYFSTDLWRNFACLDAGNRLNWARKFNGFSWNMRNAECKHWTVRVTYICSFFLLLADEQAERTKAFDSREEQRMKQWRNRSNGFTGAEFPGTPGPTKSFVERISASDLNRRRETMKLSSGHWLSWMKSKNWFIRQPVRFTLS